MPNITAVLKEEIVRLARKEIRKQTTVLRRASAQYRKDIAAMKRRVSDLQRKVTPLEKQVLKNVPTQAAEADLEAGAVDRPGDGQRELRVLARRPGGRGARRSP